MVGCHMTVTEICGPSSPSMLSLEALVGPSSPDSPLSRTLAILFEPSPILFCILEPQLQASLTTVARGITSYADLVGLSISQIQSWDKDLQALFIAAHPRIGENKNLSALSANEQGATVPTSLEVLNRLAHLNACYEKRYPGLRYIIFVDGRSRAAVAEVMEDQLGFAHSLSPSEPAIGEVLSVDIGGEEWTLELNRAVQDVGRIAKSRLISLGLE
ncbi:hypothetical protein E1B28_007610 [Marasmius oreades]|uniref:Oxo-4-hydroxy-4-carboxy-5-ureidoimidazoline decarboxylase domain-containing protein n=1 Tax=Marasmius oreades TaxID=181124 RepID=A0A9P7UU75_9AGAR|nr:uncharacterized protein E1B28_007610 [Marasmius oreades]KAG7093980.1 hypothetical protein E1B28_007610 [Marasmius oreades]